jgi:hypothetical protein
MGSPKTRTITLNDFSGGLRISRNPSQLALNESPDLQNVDFDPRGGFRRRHGYGTYMGDLGRKPTSFGVHQEQGLTPRLLVDANGLIYAAEDGVNTWTFLGNAQPNYRTVFCSALGNTYVQDGRQAPRRYDGNQLLQLQNSFNDDLEMPVGNVNTFDSALVTPGSMPVARLMAFVSDGPSGHMFVANLQEEPTWIGNPNPKRYPSRVRWSHPTNETLTFGPEDWRKDDYIDLEPDVDGDEIVQMVQFQDHLVVFKHNSVWGLYGSAPNNIVASLIARDIGAVGPDSVVVTPHGVFFFSWPEGLYMWDGQTVRWLMEPIQPIVESNINPQHATKIVVGYHDRKVYLSVPWETDVENTRTFVLDLSIGNGVWTKYGFGVGQILEFQRVNKSTLFLACSNDSHFLLWLNKKTPRDSRDANPSNDTDVVAFYQTAWFHDGELAYKHRWRRPEYVVRFDNASLSVNALVYYDFDSSTSQRSHNINVGSTGTEMVRGQLLGKTRSVSLKFFESSGLARWAVQAVTLKYWPGQVGF